MKLNFAREAAQHIVETLGPACARIEIAGSVRREKAEPGDIEIVCISRPARPVFGASPLGPLETVLDNLRLAETVRPRPDERDRTHWGPKSKRALWWYGGQEIKVDLFATDAACWPVVFALRTGDAEFSHALVTPRNAGGLLPNGMRVTDGRLYAGAHPVALAEESDLFDALDLPWINPRERNAATARIFQRRFQSGYVLSVQE